MSHMVIYRGSDGKPGYHQTDDIHDAVGFVEQMRNEDGVEHARIFRLEEVVFDFKPYYRVQLTDSTGAPVSGGSSESADVGEIESGDDPASIDGSEDASASSSDGDAAEDGDQADGDGSDDAVTTVAGAKKGLFGR